MERRHRQNSARVIKTDRYTDRQIHRQTASESLSRERNKNASKMSATPKSPTKTADNNT